jgi:uncharacterized protein YcnI
VVVAARRMPRRRRGVAVAALTVAALAVPGHVAAHGVLVPQAAASGTVQRFELTVPNDRQDADLTGVAVELPDGVEVESAEAKQPLWAVSSDAQSVSWSGGPIPRGGAETFAFSLRLPSQAGTVELGLVERYDDGETPPFPLVVTLTGTGDDSGGGAVGLVALVVALLALAVATGALIVVLRDRRHPSKEPPQG